ncbi:MAG: glycosyltransferase family 2 protein [Thermoleophilia bacterium]
MAEPRLLAIIPAHNEADSIAGVIDDIRAHTGADIVVVNDGSTDDTAAIALAKGAELLNMPFNLGIGSTMQTGFKFAHAQGYDVAVQVDGDGQHDAAELPALVQPLIGGECDMVLGSRYLKETGYSGSAGRRVGTAIFSRIISLMLRQRLTDATSGFRAINGKVIELFAHDYPRDYPEVEALLQVHMARFRVCEIPVKMRARGGGRSSINAFRSIYYMVKVLLALLVVMTRKRAPRTTAAD